MPSCLMMFFFFKLYGHPRDLPSSPTRRSSDLLPSIIPRTASTTASSLPSLASAARAMADVPPRRSGAEAIISSRSEEHTSEFQSRQYLVCRLLLEKKTQTPLCFQRDLAPCSRL